MQAWAVYERYWDRGKIGDAEIQRSCDGVMAAVNSERMTGKFGEPVKENKLNCGTDRARQGPVNLRCQCRLKSWRFRNWESSRNNDPVGWTYASFEQFGSDKVKCNG